MNKSNQDIYNFLIAWIREAIGDPDFIIIIANQDGVQPRDEFATIVVQSKTSKGLGAINEDLILRRVDGTEDDWEEAIDLHQTGLFDSDVSLQFFRGDAHEYARKVLFFPNTHSSKMMLGRENLSLFVPKNYTTLDQTEDTEYIPRTQIDLLLQSSTEYVETVNVINEVDLDIN